MQRIFFILLILFFHASAFAENAKDSLLLELKKSSSDTSQVSILLKFSELERKNNKEKSRDYLSQAISLAESLKNEKKLFDSYFSLGEFYFLTNKYDSAILSHTEASVYSQFIIDKKRLGSFNLAFGLAYYYAGKYDIAMKKYFEALKFDEDAGYTVGVTRVKMCIGNIHYVQKNYNEALKFYLEGAKSYEKEKSKMGESQANNNIGLVYYEINNDSLALIYFNKALILKKEVGDKQGVATAFTNIGKVFIRQEKYSAALDYFEQSIAILEEIKFKQGMDACYVCIGTVYNKQKKYKDALTYLEKGLAVACEIQCKEDTKESYFQISESYAGMKNFEKAFEYHKLFTDFKDSLQNEEKAKKIAEIEAKYQSDKQADEITILKQKDDLNSAQIGRQNSIIIFSLVCVLLFAVLAFFIYRNNREKQKTNKLLAQKNIEILDSIHYAKRIQQSQMPTEKYIERVLNRLRKKS